MTSRGEFSNYQLDLFANIWLQKWQLVNWLKLTLAQTWQLILRLANYSLAFVAIWDNPWINPWHFIVFSYVYLFALYLFWINWGPAVRLFLQEMDVSAQSATSLKAVNRLLVRCLPKPQTLTSQQIISLSSLLNTPLIKCRWTRKQTGAKE